MIIDTILDRRECKFFTEDDVQYIRDQAEFFHFDYITDAFEFADNKRRREALCRYIDEGNYNPVIKDFINAVDWTPFGRIIYDKRG